MMKKMIFSLGIFAAATAYGQNTGIGTTAPNASAQLDVTATNKGVLIPRIALTGTADTATIPSPATSLMVYNTATAGTSPNNVVPGYYYWNGTQWQKVGGNDWSLTGNAGTDPNKNFIGTTDGANLTIKAGQDYFNNNISSIAGFISNTNTGFGYNSSVNSQTVGKYNTAIGVHSHLYNKITTGSNNTFVGSGALNYLQSGNYNTALGSNAGSTYVGNNNVFLGSTFYSLGGSSSGVSGDYILAIGTNAYPEPYTESYTMNINNTIFGRNVNDGNHQPFYDASGGDTGWNLTNDLVGISTPNPSERLDVNGNIKVRGTNTAISDGGNCTNPGTISYGTDGNFYGCTGTRVWKKLNN